MSALPTVWVAAFRRTNDPKLAYVEHVLTVRGIPHRRNGHSWHAPILEVPAEHQEAAWNLLGEDVFGDGEDFDVIPDDDSVFDGYQPHDWLGIPS